MGSRQDFRQPAPASKKSGARVVNAGFFSVRDDLPGRSDCFPVPICQGGRAASPASLETLCLALENSRHSVRRYPT
jgi:hypothetical protein